ncbi:MAG: hypothetical protein ACKOUM_05005 [Sphingopyxis sp.]
MFIGHWAPAFAVAAHPKSPRLGTLLVAAQLVDIGFFSLTLVGVERMRITPGISVMNGLDLYHMPYTHSLVGTLLCAGIFTALLWLWHRNRAAAVLGGVVVASHWFLDLLVHVPDLTIWGAPPKLGLALWNRPMVEIPLELGLTFGAMALYAARNRPSAPRATLALGVLAATLLAIQLINWFGPQPETAGAGPSIMALATYALVIILGIWVGRTRGGAHNRG